MERSTETINDLSNLIKKIDDFDFVPGFNDDELDQMFADLDSYPREEVFAELISWIEHLENAGCRYHQPS